MQRHRYLSSTHFQLHELHPLLNIIVVRMHQYNQNKIDGLGTRPEFEKGMYFYVPVGVILIELEEIESRNLLHDETEFEASNDTMTSKDYTFVSQYLSSVIAIGDWS
jgi:hypothetical protein